MFEFTRTVVNRFYNFRSTGGFYHGGLGPFVSCRSKFKSVSLQPTWHVPSEVVRGMEAMLQLSLLHLL